MVKRITHRHKIDEDVFVQKSGELIATALPYYEEHKTQLLRIASYVAGGLLVAVLIWSFVSKSTARASAELDDAIQLAVAGLDGAPESTAAKSAEAKTKLETFLQNHSGSHTSWAHLYLGRLLLNEGQIDPAIEQFRTFLAKAPSEAAPLGRLALGYALLKAGKKDEAQREWEELKRQNWNPDGMDLELAALQLQSDPEKATATLKTLSAKSDSMAAAPAKEKLRLYAPTVDNALVIKGLPDPAPGQAPVADPNAPVTGVAPTEGAAIPAISTSPAAVPATTTDPTSAAAAAGTTAAPAPVAPAVQPAAPPAADAAPVPAVIQPTPAVPTTEPAAPAAQAPAAQPQAPATESSAAQPQAPAAAPVAAPEVQSTPAPPAPEASSAGAPGASAQAATPVP